MHYISKEEGFVPNDHNLLTRYAFNAYTAIFVCKCEYNVIVNMFIRKSRNKSMKKVLSQYCGLFLCLSVLLKYSVKKADFRCVCLSVFL